MSKPYTPVTLGERWSCNEKTIRLMIARGELPAFKAGKQWRISAETVSKWESIDRSTSGNSLWEPSTADQLQRGMKAATDAAFASVRRD